MSSLNQCNGGARFDNLSALSAEDGLCLYGDLENGRHLRHTVNGHAASERSGLLRLLEQAATSSDASHDGDGYPEYRVKGRSADATMKQRTKFP